ncbi:MAG TPA: hypothetical protein IAD11_05895 [Candidatus Stercorousia faecigallinarum]|nr:hypothetical protein [Candidatus Stercorousia faecigallinarum]
MKKNSFLTSLLTAALLAAANFALAADRTIVKDGETLNIQDKTYNNIQYEGAGGAVSVESKGKIDNINSSIFDGNTAKNGGAISTTYMISDETLSSPIIGAINNSIFTNNVAIGVYTKDDDLSHWPNEVINGYGGAINSYAVINEINNTIFSNNRVDIALTTENPQYDLLQVSAEGGAVYGRVANIVNSRFTDNYVKSNGVSGGGALALQENYLYRYLESDETGFMDTEVTKLPAFNIKDSTFENNRAEGLYAAGGALTAAGEVNITNTKFTSNKAENAGGAAYFPGITLNIFGPPNEEGEQELKNIIYSDISIKDSTFENNSVTNDKPSDIYSNYFVDDQGTITAKEEGYITTPQGGAIYSGGNLSIDNTVFKGNSALKTNENGLKEGQGGAIYSNSAGGNEELSYFPGLKVTNSKFENNNSAEGGAIYNEGTVKEFKGNTFTGNNALQEYQNVTDNTYDDNGITVSQNSVQKSHSGSGGAIYNKNADINIENNTFENNKAAYGGAIFNEVPDENSTANLNIKDSKFINNSSYNEDSDSGTLTVGDKTYTWNNEHYGLGSGGAIVSYGDTTIENSEFTGNTTGGDGGAMYVSGNLTVKNSNFKNNVAKANNKGTTYNYKGNGEVEQVDYNYDDGYGGAISHGGENLTIENSTFEGNIAGGEGGGAISSGGNIDITDSIFNSNSSSLSGGAIDSLSYSNNSSLTLNITDSEFNNNKVTTDYGLNIQEMSGWKYNPETHMATKLSDGTTKYASINSDGYIKIYHDDGSDEIIARYSQLKGGAINSNSSSININNTKFKGNAVALDSQSNEEMATYSGLGGALSANGKVTVTNSEFTGNKVSVKYTENYDYISENGSRDQDIYNGEVGTGGAINNTGELTVTGSKFTQNSAAYGGAINNIGITVIKDSEFNNNISNSLVTGKTIFTYNDNEHTKDVTWHNGFGGAVRSEGDITIEDSKYNDNIAAEMGGAVYISGDNITATVKNSIFNNNVAKSKHDEGFFSVNEQGEVIYNDESRFDGYGGAIAIDGWNKSKLFIENSEFNKNIAGDAGGGAIATFTNTEINNTKFNANEAELGGAIRVIGGEPDSILTLNNSLFDGNKATSNGGAVNTGGDVNITDTNFTNNSAKQGGAIFAVNNDDEQNGYTDNSRQKPKINITALNKDVKFSGNTAEKGGDIYIAEGTLNLNANQGKEISFNGGIVGKNAVININDSSVNSLYENLSSVGKIVIDNFVSPDENSALSVNLKAGTLALTQDNYLDRTDLTLEEGSLLDLGNNNVGEMNLNSLTSNNANLKIDMNLASSDQVFDTIKAATATGTLNLQNVNIMSDFADTTKNEYTASITPDGLELKTPENGINVLTNEYVYTIKAKDNNLTVNRLADENGEALKTDGFTVAVNQTDKVGGVDVALSDDRIYSANNDIKITATNSETGWTGELGGKSLTVNGNGYTLDGEDNAGFAVNNGQTLTFNDTNIKGFAPVPERKGALTVNDGGSVNINASNNDISLGNNADTDVIYLDGTSSKALLTTENNKSITVNDKISSANSSNELNLNGDGNISFNNKVQQLTLTNENTNTVHNTYVDGVNYNLNSGMVTFTKDEYLNGQGNKNTLNFNGGTLNLANNSVGTIDLAALNINSNSNIMLDADLAQETMDKITASSATANKDAILNVSEINLLSDATKDKVEINAVDPAIILNENDTLASHIATSVTEVAYSPIYKYGVGYDPTTGNFSFTRGSSQNYNNVNPSVMVGPVAAQLGGYMGMLDTYNNAFNNMDMRMLNPASVRLAQKQANRYAITEEADGVTYKVNETNSGGTWVRPFAAYDSVGLSNGPKVSNMSYGTFIGGDSAIHQFKNGGEGVLSAHVSYLGSHQSFNGNSIYQNGGNLGLTGTYYKGNFFSGLTVNAGASVADASTRYGNEDFPMLTAGVANKTGYNFEFKDGRFIIQPSLLLSYTFVNTFDYTNAAGVSINGDPLHAFQISPNVRFALNTKNGWQPYFTVGMNWNIMNDSQFTANMATLPNLSMKPYVQYGLGIQKTINDNFTAYGQVLLRHGGRYGIAANAGLRYIFGHESKQAL